MFYELGAEIGQILVLVPLPELKKDFTNICSKLNAVERSLERKVNYALFHH
jgi:hypothetical protein